MRLVDAVGGRSTQGDGETPDQVRDRLSKIFERDEFRRSKGWWQRFLDWLEALLDGSEPNVPSSSVGSASGLGQLLAYLVIAALVIGLIVLIVMVVRGRVRRSKADVADADVLVESSEPSSREWQSMAERFEAAGEWKEAIRCRYRELVAQLVHRRSVPAIPGRTTGELRQDVVRSSPGVAATFDEATQLFELPWYADVETGPHENRRFRELASHTLSGALAGELDDSDFLVLVGSGPPDLGGAPGAQLAGESQESST